MQHAFFIKKNKKKILFTYKIFKMNKKSHVHQKIYIKKMNANKKN